MRKVYTEIKFKVVMNVDEGVEVSDVINDMDYVFTPSDNADIVDTEMIDFEITDSK